MEVTKSNFNDILPEIEKNIKNSTFLSIDCELTGLKTSLNQIKAYDTPAQYYEKVRKDSKEFLVIQYGISLFRYDKENDNFKQQSYNFYIFRRPINRYIQDQRFLCQTSSIDFLITQGFDFNKLFKEGISYLNQEEESKAREMLSEQQKRRIDAKNAQQNGSSDIIQIPDDAKEFIEDIVSQLQNFIESDELELQLPKCNSFLRRLIYRTSSEKFQGKISLETRQIGRERVLFATRLKSAAELEEIETKQYEDSINLLEDYVGFTKVLRMIIESGKLIIGHNLMLDLLHTIEKFVTPLPEDYREFKDCASSLFTKVVDTKYMSSREPFKELINSNVLKHLLDTVSEKPFQIPEVEIEKNGQGYSVKDEKEHEAGYDAFITGLSFLSMWKHLGSSKKLTNTETFSDFKLLTPFINKIFLMILTDNQFVNLGGEDLKPSRDHVFYVTFPKDWKTNNIVQLFSPFGNVHISWLSETSAYVGLYKKEQAAIALSTLGQSDTYTIQSFAKRQMQLAGVRTPLPSPVAAVKRKKSFELNPPAAKKQRRTGSFGSGTVSKRSIDPIEEEEDQTSPEKETVDDNRRSKKRTFEEDESWE